METGAAAVVLSPVCSLPVWFHCRPLSCPTFPPQHQHDAGSYVTLHTDTRTHTQSQDVNTWWTSMTWFFNRFLGQGQVLLLQWALYIFYSQEKIPINQHYEDYNQHQWLILNTMWLSSLALLVSGDTGYWNIDHFLICIKTIVLMSTSSKTSFSFYSS